MATYARFSPRALHRAVLTANALRLMQALPLAAFVPRGKNRPPELTTEPLTEWVAVRRQAVHLAARTITGAGNYRVTAAATLVLAEALLDPARRDGISPRLLRAPGAVHPARARGAPPAKGPRRESRHVSSRPPVADDGITRSLRDLRAPTPALDALVLSPDRDSAQSSGSAPTPDASEAPAHAHWSCPVLEDTCALPVVSRGK